MSEKPPAFDAERQRILSQAMQEAFGVFFSYMDPAYGVSQEDALNDLIVILDRREVAEAAGIEFGPPQPSRPRLTVVK